MTLWLLIGFASLLVFGAVALLIVGLGRQRQTDPLSTRLQAMGAETSLDTLPWWQARRGRRGFLEKFLTRIAGFLPSANGEDSLRDGLIEAGYRSQGAVAVFLGSKLALAALLPVIAAIVMTAMGLNPFTGTRLMMLIGAGVLGFYLPTLWLWDASNKRKLEIQHALPDSLDLMVVCVEAGLGLDAAMAKVATEIGLGSPEVSWRCSCRRIVWERASRRHCVRSRIRCASGAASERKRWRTRPASSSSSRS
jgi:tight adherence protein C